MLKNDISSIVTILTEYDRIQVPQKNIESILANLHKLLPVIEKEIVQYEEEVYSKKLSFNSDYKEAEWKV